MAFLHLFAPSKAEFLSIRLVGLWSCALVPNTTKGRILNYPIPRFFLLLKCYPLLRGTGITSSFVSAGGCLLPTSYRKIEHSKTMFVR